MSPGEPRLAAANAVSEAVTANAHPPVEDGRGKPCLVVTSSSCPEAVGRVFPLGEEALVLGRAEDASARLEDQGISRHHATVQRSASGEFTIADLRSTNGTHLNGIRVRTAALHEGDRVQIGTATVLRFSRHPNLEETELRLRQALAVAGVGTWEWDAATGSLTFSGGAERLVSGSGRNAWPAVHAEERTQLRDGLARAAAVGGPVSLECRIHGEDDRISWIAMRGEVLADESGTALRVAGALVDVSSRKKAEHEMRRNALMFECLNDAVLVVSLGGTIDDWNAAAVRLFGYAQAEALGRAPEELLEPGEPEPFLPAAVAGIASHGHWKGERRLRRKSGDECTAEIVAVPLRDGEGHHLANLVVCRDVGEQRQLQAQLMFSDRLSAIGTLAAGVAHEINNPLAFVHANLGYLEEVLKSGVAEAGERWTEAQSVLQDVREGVERIALIVRDLKSYSREGSEDETAGADVARAVQYAVRVVNSEIRDRAEVVLQLADVPLVNIIESRLSQILVNLLVNAAHAIAGPASQNEIRISSVWNEGAGAVLLRVSDTGAGIPAAILPRIFDPFFTTKPVGTGTGLGLFVCSNLAKAAGGGIAVETRPGHGTTFTVSLPPAASAAAAPPPAVQI